MIEMIMQWVIKQGIDFDLIEYRKFDTKESANSAFTLLKSHLYFIWIA